MRITELIERLSFYKENFGNIEVTTVDIEQSRNWFNVPEAKADDELKTYVDTEPKLLFERKTLHLRIV